MQFHLCIVVLILNLITYTTIVKKHGEKIEFTVYWSVGSMLWLIVVQKLIPKHYHSKFPIISLGIAWPILIGASEMFALLYNSNKDNRGSVQMDMGALLNIGFSLSAASLLAKESGEKEIGKTCVIMTSGVIILCLCFLMPSPALIRTPILQRMAISYATGLLLITSTINVSLKLKSLCE